MRSRMPRAARPWAALVLVLTMLAGCAGDAPATPTGPPGSGTPAATARVATGTPEERIGDAFLQLLAVSQTQGPDAARVYAADAGLLNPRGDLGMTLLLDAADAATVGETVVAVGRFGARITATYDDRVQLVVPLPALLDYGKRTNRTSLFHDLAETAHVRAIQITPPPAPTAGTPTVPPTLPSRVIGGITEGIAVTYAAQWQGAGITGKGVKVGVIDGSFTGYQRILGASRVTAKSFRSDDAIEDEVADLDSVHGTGCAEIIREFAPDTELFLAPVDSAGAFLNAMDWLTNTIGVSVISISLAWRGTYPTDGTSKVAQSVDTARKAGVVVTVAAGNYASGRIGSAAGEGYLAGTFADKDKDGYNDFPDARSKNGVALKVAQEDQLTLNLYWDDWKNPSVNYDLFLLNSAGKEVARSANNQGRGFDPVEQIRRTVPAGDYMLKIKKASADAPDLPFGLHFTGAQFELVSPGGSLGVPGDARGALTVGAIDVRTDIAKEYTSQGPTKDGRAKPELSGPTDGLSYAYALAAKDRFGGTSAATPHVAGAAALVRQAYPNATPDMVQAYIVAHVKPPKGATQGRNITGAGRLFLDTVPNDAARVTAVPTRAVGGPRTTPAARPTGTPTARPFFADDFANTASGLPAAGYQSGEYHLAYDAKQRQDAIYPNRTVRGATTETYEVQARRVRGDAGTYVALVVRRLDEDNLIFCSIYEDGGFTMYLKASGSWQSLGTYDTSPAIKKADANILHVRIEGPLVTFSANGQRLRQVEIPDLWAEGGFGFSTGTGTQTPGEAAFKAYRVSTG